MVSRKEKMREKITEQNWPEWKGAKIGKRNGNENENLKSK